MRSLEVNKKKSINWNIHKMDEMKQHIFFSLNKLYAQCGAWTYDPEIKSHMVYPLSQPGAPKQHT